ncbi:MAG: adenylate/guanylate cyclase domain-containing protein, partial [Candidatus Riflebacteria bacterium]
FQRLKLQLSETEDRLAAMKKIVHEDYFRLFEMLYLNNIGKFIKDGHELVPKSGARDVIALSRILLDLGVMKTERREIQEFQKKHMFFNSLLDAYWDAFAPATVLAGEGLIQKNFVELAVGRSMYSIIASPGTPNLAEGIFFVTVFELSWPKFFESLYSENSAIFRDYSRDQVIDYGLFFRSYSALKAEQVPPVNIAGKNLRRIAGKVFDRKASGTIVEAGVDGTSISMWMYLENIPVVIAARGVVKATSAITTHLFVMIMLLFAYGLLSVILLSDTLSEALLAPINTFTTFVQSIEAGRPEVKAEIRGRDEFADLALSFNAMSVGLCQREKMRRFVSEKLFSSLGEKDGDTSGKRLRVSILSSDIRGFTEISERNAPEEIVSLLNSYFSEMEKAIVEFGGSVEKIVGDAILAAFYHDEALAPACERACFAALRMRELLAGFNQTRRAQGLFIIENGIGIATGEAILGFAGSRSVRREFVLIGEVVNRAEVIEAMTKSGISSRVFVDRETFEAVVERFDFCDLEIESDAISCREIKVDV